jgi:hypothetical protein
MLQRRPDLGIHFTIPFNLGSPKPDIGCGPFEQGAVMAMPETAMRKNNSFVPRENNIRSPGQCLDMQAIPESTFK